MFRPTVFTLSSALIAAMTVTALAAMEKEFIGDAIQADNNTSE